MSVRLSACKNSTPTGRVFMKVDLGIFRKFVDVIQVLLKADKNNGYIRGKTIYMYIYIYLIPRSFLFRKRHVSD